MQVRQLLHVCYSTLPRRNRRANQLRLFALPTSAVVPARSAAFLAPCLTSAATSAAPSRTSSAVCSTRGGTKTQREGCIVVAGGGGGRREGLSYVQRQGKGKQGALTQPSQEA